MKKNKVTKVSVIEPVGGHGGMNYYDIGLCDGVGRSGIDITLYTCNKNPPQSVVGVFKVKPIFINVYGKDPSWRRGLRYVKALVTALIIERITGSKLIHFHFFYVGPLEFLSVLLARCLNFRVVVTAHDVESFKEDLSVKSLVMRTYAMVHAVVAHNKTSAVEVVRKLGVNEERIHIIPHGSYVDFIEKPLPREVAKKRIGLGEAANPVILFFGQIKQVKGLDLLIKAFALVSNDFPNAQLVIAGRVWKDDFSKYEKLIDDNNIEQRVKLHIRYVADDEVNAFYSAADVVVLPYRRIYQSGVLLMAMSFGIPVLTSDLDAMKEIVVDGENGYLFESDNQNDLAIALRRVLSDINGREKVSKAALNNMDVDFNWLTIGAKLANMYRLVGN